MHDMMKRHEVQLLRRAGHTQADVTRLTGVSEREVRRIEQEPLVATMDNAGEHKRRRLGRPSKAEPFRALVARVLAEEPELFSLEILRRARLEGYAGGKSALHDEDLAAAIVDRVLERGRHLKLDGPSMRTRHLGLDDPTAAEPSTQPARTSGIRPAEFPEPTSRDEVRRGETKREWLAEAGLAEFAQSPKGLR